MPKSNNNEDHFEPHFKQKVTEPENKFEEVH